MAQSEILIHGSRNGDRWVLLIDADSGGYMVRHEPCRASGGAVSLQTTLDFLARGHCGPEHDALRQMLHYLRVPTGGGTEDDGPSPELPAPSRIL